MPIGGRNIFPPIDSPALDAFGRQRVSNPLTLFDSKQIHDTQPLFWDDAEESGAGTSSTHDVDNARTRIAVSDATAGVRTRQTFMCFNYQPGKSQLIKMTAVLCSGGGAGIKASMGLFNDNNGLFITEEAGILKFVLRSKTSGAPVDIEIPQSEWNVDTFGGGGPKTRTIDITKSQIVFFDLEWLGVGRVRAGFIIDGQYMVAHEFLNSNNLTSVYMSTPNLPLRYQISNDGAGGAAFLDHLCSTVISEGGQSNTGISHYLSTEGTHVDCDVENTLYAILGMRLKATHVGSEVKVEGVTVAEHAGTKEYEWILLFNPTVAGTFTYADETNSAVRRASGITANTVTGGLKIGGGFASSAQKGGNTVERPINNVLRLGATIAGLTDQIVLAVRPVGGTSLLNIEGSISYRETP